MFNWLKTTVLSAVIVVLFGVIGVARLRAFARGAY